MTTEVASRPIPSPTLRTVLADDERLAIEKLRLLLATDPSVRIVGECRTVKETREAVKSFRPDLLLLDIEMPDGTGFDALEGWNRGNLPIVIFTTAYDQYAIRAFEARALDYLLKPFDAERLSASIERAKGEWLKANNDVLTSCLADLLKNPVAHRSKNERLVVKSRGRVFFLDPEEIDWMEASANYVCVHLRNGASYEMREAISRLAERLDPSRFARIHRSYIVNLSKIREAVPCNSGEYMVVLKDGKELSCSRTYQSAIQSLVHNGRH
ncbi:MAG TPA: LytTR family DNA-binding domain-containing protein [Terriglobales bacterium]|nr:LytTR family DNA-binding domain-containing protein [Terriglobales bacterium]